MNVRTPRAVLVIRFPVDYDPILFPAFRFVSPSKFKDIPHDLEHMQVIVRKMKSQKVPKLTQFIMDSSQGYILSSTGCKNKAMKLKL